MVSPLPRRAFLRRAGLLAVANATAPLLESFPERLDSFRPLKPNQIASATPAGQFPTFYVSAAGSDSADGLSPERAWATLRKVSSSLPPERSVVLLRRGDTFYGELKLPIDCDLGAFGDGDRPVVTMFKILNRPRGWKEYSHGVWTIDLGIPSTHEGYTLTKNANIGYLLVDGQIRPNLKTRVSELRSTWDFFCDTESNVLFVAASETPTNLATDIRAAPNGENGRVIDCSEGSNRIRDVHVTGSGGCGIAGVGPDVHIHDCLIDYIGGAMLLDGTSRRYGNGIENWVGVKRWLIEHNEIAHVYDVAWSAQGRAGANGSWEDITVRKNHIHHCSQSFEFWSSGDKRAGGYKRILVENNQCESAGYSAFSEVRPDQNVRVHILTYRWETPADITVQNNIFDQAYSSYCYHENEPLGYISRNNEIRLRAGQKIEHQRPETIEQAATWTKATGREEGSAMIVAP